MKYFIYIVECADGTFYTGFTINIEKRVKKHNSKNGAKYVRTRLPVRLIYNEEFETRIDAMRREVEIKKWSRERKMRLINGI